MKLFDRLRNLAKAVPQHKWSFNPHRISLCGETIDCFEIATTQDSCWIAQVMNHRGCADTKQGDATVQQIVALHNHLPEIIQALEQRARLWDLVRCQRSELFDADLITQDEYDELAQDHGAVARLESYDSMRARITELETQLELSRSHEVLPKEVL